MKLNSSLRIGGSAAVVAATMLWLCLVLGAQETTFERTLVGTDSQKMEGPPTPHALKRGAEKEEEAARKEAEISKKELQLKEERAKVEREEADLARQEAEIVKKTALSPEEIQEAIEKADHEEREATVAQEKVKIFQEKMRAAEEKVRLAQEELSVAEERAIIAEKRLRERWGVLGRKLIQTVLVLIIGYSFFIIVVKFVNRGVKDLKVKHLLRRGILYVLTVLMLVYIAFVWFQNVSSLTIIFGVAGAGIALALQEVLLCIAAWLYIILRRPFEIGERVELGGIKGDVIDIRLFQTALLEVGNWVEGEQSTGRMVNVPNSMVFKKESYNYSKGFEFIWNEIRVLVTFESDWKRGEEIMLTHARSYTEGMEKLVSRKIDRMARHYLIYYEKLTPIVYVDIKDSGVQLTLRHLVEARSRRIAHDALCRKILEDFENEKEVNFAYTTYRIVKTDISG